MNPRALYTTYLGPRGDTYLVPRRCNTYQSGRCPVSRRLAAMHTRSPFSTVIQPRPAAYEIVFCIASVLPRPFCRRNSELQIFDGCESSYHTNLLLSAQLIHTDQTIFPPSHLHYGFARFTQSLPLTVCCRTTKYVMMRENKPVRYVYSVPCGRHINDIHNEP